MMRRPPQGKRRDAQRGIALIMALIMVVLMTAYGVEFGYSSHVNSLSAYHHRDTTRSYYLAKSGIRTYGMLLVFARQISGNSMVTGMLSQFGLNIDGADMLCRSVPFLDTALLRALTQMGSGMMSDEEEDGLLGLLGAGGSGEPDENSPFQERGTTDEAGEEEATLRRKLLEFEGDFKVDCIDESSKIDINGFGKTAWAGLALQQHPIAQMLHGLMSPPEYDPLFEERLKIDRWELIGNLRDWIDPDSERSGLFGGDEDRLYADYEPRYRAKNAVMDSVEETRLVAGVTDEVWSTFGPALSVHTSNQQINVNAADAAMIRALVRAFSDPLVVTDQRLDTEIIPLLMAERAFLPGPFRNAQDFISRVKAKQVVFLSPQAENQLKALVRTDSRFFRLRATGYVNDSTRTIDVIIRVNKSGVQYLEWKER